MADTEHANRRAYARSTGALHSSGENRSPGMNDVRGESRQAKKATTTATRQMVRLRAQILSLLTEAKGLGRRLAALLTGCEMQTFALRQPSPPHGHTQTHADIQIHTDIHGLTHIRTRIHTDTHIYTQMHTDAHRSAHTGHAYT